MNKDSAVDRMRKLQKEMTALQAAAKDELLANIRGKISELNKLGFTTS